MFQGANRALYDVTGVVILVADSYHPSPALGYKGLYWRVDIDRYSDTHVCTKRGI